MHHTVLLDLLRNVCVWERMVFSLCNTMMFSVILCMYSCSQLQIGWHSILRLFLKTFDWVPGVPGFSRDSSAHGIHLLMRFIICYLLLIVNRMVRILVRWNFFWNNLEIQCHPISNRLYHTGCMCACLYVQSAIAWFSLYEFAVEWCSLYEFAVEWCSLYEFAVEWCSLYEFAVEWWL